MDEESGGQAPAEFASTHPSPENRIESLISQWIEVLPLYNQAHEEGRVPNCVLPQTLDAAYQKKQAEKKAGE